MRIKIIVPPYVNQPLFLRMMPRSMTFFPPYGASCLASTLRNNGYSVSVEDVSLLARNLKMPPIFLDNKRELKSIVEYLRFDSPDKKIDRFANELFKYISQDGSEVIGFSIFSRLELVCALLLAKKIKENTQAKIVLGGALMTEYAALKSLQKMESILNNFKFVDFVIFGDGCVPFLALLENIKGLRPIETVPNLAYRDKANIAIREKTFYSIQDMPAPDFDGLDLDKYKAVQYEQIKNKKIEAFSKFFQLPYQLSRGCPQGCSFCDCYLTDPQIVFKDPPKVINELWHLKERYRARNFYFCECKINISYEYLERLCDGVIDNNLDIVWKATAGVNNMDRNLLEKMKAAGCYALTWDIESGSDKLLEKMNKGFSSEKARQILRLSHEIGIFNIIKLTSGFVQETDQDINMTIQFIKESAHYVEWARIFIFILTPDTPIYNRPGAYGIENIFFDLRSSLGFGRLGFDENGGLKWGEKIIQQDMSFKKIRQAVDRYILAKKPTS